MEVEMYDKVLLKDGRAGYIVENFHDVDYMIELDDEKAEERVITISKDEIERKIL